MTEESRVSRTPRTWTKDSEEPPADVKLLRYRNTLAHPFLRRSVATDESGEGGWVLETHASPKRWRMGGDVMSWDLATWHTQDWGPLVEVLPDAPEPQPETVCGAPNGEQSCAEPLGHEGQHVAKVNVGGREYVAPWVDDQLVEDTKGIAERCYYEGCPEWITGASDYCPKHAAEFAPGSSAGGSSVSSLSDDTTRPDKPATEALSPEIPEMRVGMVDDTWVVALADSEGGWVAAGTWEPLANDEVAEWTEVHEAVNMTEFQEELYNRAVAAENALTRLSGVELRDAEGRDGEVQP